MEYVEGQDLKQAIRPLSASRWRGRTPLRGMLNAQSPIFKGRGVSASRRERVRIADTERHAKGDSVRGPADLFVVVSNVLHIRHGLHAKRIRESPVRHRLVNANEARLDDARLVREKALATSANCSRGTHSIGHDNYLLVSC
jgi:hypothetical protein